MLQMFMWPGFDVCRVFMPSNNIEICLCAAYFLLQYDYAILSVLLIDSVRARFIVSPIHGMGKIEVKTKAQPIIHEIYNIHIGAYENSTAYLFTPIRNMRIVLLHVSQVTFLDAYDFGDSLCIVFAIAFEFIALNPIHMIRASKQQQRLTVTTEHCIQRSP